MKIKTIGLRPLLFALLAALYLLAGGCSGSSKSAPFGDTASGKSVVFHVGQSHPVENTTTFIQLVAITEDSRCSGECIVAGTFKAQFKVTEADGSAQTIEVNGIQPVFFLAATRTRPKYRVEMVGVSPESKNETGTIPQNQYAITLRIQPFLDAALDTDTTFRSGEPRSIAGTNTEIRLREITNGTPPAVEITLFDPDYGYETRTITQGIPLTTGAINGRPNYQIELKAVSSQSSAVVLRFRRVPDVALNQDTVFRVGEARYIENTKTLIWLTKVTQDTRPDGTLAIEVDCVRPYDEVPEGSGHEEIVPVTGNAPGTTSASLNGLRYQIVLRAASPPKQTTADSIPTNQYQITLNVQKITPTP